MREDSAGCLTKASWLIRLTEYGALRVSDGRFVDPFRVAKLQDSNWPLAFTLPSANVKWRGAPSVRASFRMALDEQLAAVATRFSPGDSATSLRATLFALASLRKGPLATGDPTKIKLHRCPDCGQAHVEVTDSSTGATCDACGKRLFASDSLRIWEEVEEHQSNGTAIGRSMLAIEHILPVHFMRYLLKTSPRALSGMVFFIDGPLAVFGTTAWLHSPIQRFIHDTNQRLGELDLPGVLFIGLQKTGQIVDHMALINRFIPNNRLFPIDDDYRYKYILSGQEESEKGFGENTYYGQDFIFKTPSGRTFVFAIPFPWSDKSAIPDFRSRKTDIGVYPSLPIALHLICKFESDLYANAVVPIALAHRFTAISLVPGGQVLNLLTARALEVQEGNSHVNV